MALVLNSINMEELEAEKYWSFPSSYSEERKKTETKNMVFSGDYIGSRKYDGFYYRFIKDMSGNSILQSRNRGVSGNFSNKIGHIPHLHDFFARLPKGTMVLGELYLPDQETSKAVSTVMGCLEPKAIERQKRFPLHYYIFDIWAYDGESYLNKPASHRFAKLQELSLAFPHPNVNWAQFLTGEKLWTEYQSILVEGGEGIVIVKKDSIPTPGKRPARKTLKLKKELLETLDVVVMGANEPTRAYTGKNLENWVFYINMATGERKQENFYEDYQNGGSWEPVTRNYFYGWAGSLRIGALKNGKIVQVGSISGLEDRILEDWQSYVGKVMEISAMEVYQDTGGIRHPRFIQWRPDLTPADCAWEKIFG